MCHECRQIFYRLAIGCSGICSSYYLFVVQSLISLIENVAESMKLRSIAEKTRGVKQLDNQLESKSFKGLGEYHDESSFLYR